MHLRDNCIPTHITNLSNYQEPYINNIFNTIDLCHRNNNFDHNRYCPL